ncbi:MAG: undecaprenyl-diphosphatase UppP [Myxococcaceae bacterium]|nr:undecaprenyl-diphosphatase UppP [Myxococcaceae bacterium]MBH2006337.1 undecaprenyl-diphosphatase UppP [Myxococcaceae bacterium]
MDLTQASVLGLVQGLTEYLPVSSSAHLVLVPQWLDWEFEPKQAFIFNVLVQLGTLLGVIVYFFKDLRAIAIAMIRDMISGSPFREPEARLGWMVVLATIPAAVVGLLWKSEISAFFASVRSVYGFLMVTAALLAIAEACNRGVSSKIRWLDAGVMGLAQAFALLPGISRSGATIAAGVGLGLSKTEAARFSFFMSIPVMLGASIVAAKDGVQDMGAFETMVGPILLGMLVAMTSGYLVIAWFMRFLQTKSLLWFSAYCGIVGISGLLFS